MHFISIIKGQNNQVCTLISDGQDVQYMASKSKSNTMYTNSDINVNIAKRKPIQEEVFNYEGEKSIFVKYPKRTQQTKRTKQTRRKKLLTTHKGNA